MATCKFAIFATFAFYAISSVPSAQAQATSNATCSNQYSWMMNSKNQTPCLVSAYLSAECNNGLWNVPAIGTSGPYVHPTGSGANICRCSTVTWSLLSACSICQGGPGGTWTDWVSNCTTDAATVGYPLPLPSGVAIPSWAYLDFRSQGQFQVQEAQQYAASNQAPESMSAASQAQTQGTSSANTVATRSSPSPTSSPSAAASEASPSSSSSNAGAIAGGVVGGIIALALLALIAWVLIRKKRRQAAAPSEKFTYPGQPGYEDGGYAVKQQVNAAHYAPLPAGSSDRGGHNGSQGYPYPYSNATHSSRTMYRPYDPNDPSTYPAAPAARTPAVSTDHSHSGTLHSQQQRPGRYNYTAEL